MQAIMETLFDIVYDASKPVDQCCGPVPKHLYLGVFTGTFPLLSWDC